MVDVPPLSIRISDDVRASVSTELHREVRADGTAAIRDPLTFARTGAKHLRNHLPAALLGQLSAWRREPAPWLTVRNLPRPARRVPTPVDGFGDESVLGVPNLIHFGLLELLGLTPVAYRWENEGRLVRNVAPRPDSGRALTSWGFGAPLDWHTDDSVLDHREPARSAVAIPHYLSFYGMRNEERVPTDLLALDLLLRDLPADATADLRRPEFTVVAPESYATAGEDGGPMRCERVPLLWTLPDGHDAVRYGPDRVAGDTPRAARALARFEALLATAEGESVLIEAGDFHIFDNRRVLHRRVRFLPGAPGEARWLRRCYARGR